MSDDISAVERIVSVSRETAARLEAFVALLRKWQVAENLVAGDAVTEIWSRHVADSAQLVALFPMAQVWVDLGSGGGFPGMVVAILGTSTVHLVESNTRKCAFLRAAIRETQATAIVHEGRAETILRRWDTPVDRISARAVAPLPALLSLAEPLMSKGVPAAFLKGVDYRRELDEARRDWDFGLTEYPSRTQANAAILDISALNRTRESG